MGEKKLTGIYFYNPNGHSSTVDYSAIAEYVRKNSDVSVVWDSQDISLSDNNKVVDKIKEGKP